MSRKADRTGWKKRQSRVLIFLSGMMIFCGCGLWLNGCGSRTEGEGRLEAGAESVQDGQGGGEQENMLYAVDFDHELDDYEPLKKEYNFYFTYKMVHPWWDAVALGIEDAAGQYEAGSDDPL